nr:MAG TPA: hypothetical protein [Caudoviricetes sp.]
MPGVPDMSKPQGQRQGAAPTGGYEHPALAIRKQCQLIQ